MKSKRNFKKINRKNVGNLLVKLLVGGAVIVYILYTLLQLVIFADKSI